MMDSDMARTMRSGTRVGPGIWRNGRPGILAPDPGFRERQECRAAFSPRELPRHGLTAEPPAVDGGGDPPGVNEQAVELVTARGRFLFGQIDHERLAQRLPRQRRLDPVAFDPFHVARALIPRGLHAREWDVPHRAERRHALE